MFTLPSHFLRSRLSLLGRLGRTRAPRGALLLVRRPAHLHALRAAEVRAPAPGAQFRLGWGALVAEAARVERSLLMLALHDASVLGIAEHRARGLLLGQIAILLEHDGLSRD